MEALALAEQTEVLTKDEQILYDFYWKELMSKVPKVQKHYISYFENQIQKTIESSFVVLDYSKFKVVRMVVQKYKEKNN